MGLQNTVKYKINKLIKPLSLENRKTVDLIMGELYYVSFWGNVVYQCELLDIIESENKALIRRGDMACLININELGATPSGAVLNQVIYN